MTMSRGNPQNGLVCQPLLHRDKRVKPLPALVPYFFGRHQGEQTIANPIADQAGNRKA